MGWIWLYASHECIEVALERTALAEVASDGAECHLGRLSGKRADFTIGAVNECGLGIRARDLSAYNLGKEAKELGKTKAWLGRRANLAFPGIVEGLQRPRTEAVVGTAGWRQVLGTNPGSFKWEWASGSGLNDKWRHIGLGIDKKQQALATEGIGDNESAGSKIDLSGLRVSLEPASFAKCVNQALTSNSAR